MTETTTDPQGGTVRVVDSVRTDADFQYAWNGWKFYLTGDGEFVAMPGVMRK